MANGCHLQPRGSEDQPRGGEGERSRLGVYLALPHQSAANSNKFVELERVSLHDNDSQDIAEGTFTLTLPAVSWASVALG